MNNKNAHTSYFLPRRWIFKAQRFSKESPYVCQQENTFAHVRVFYFHFMLISVIFMFDSSTLIANKETRNHPQGGEDFKSHML